MTEHKHPHNHQHEQGKKRPIHHDWRLWVVVLLAVAGMVMYSLSDDEALQPGGKEQPAMPAAP